MPIVPLPQFELDLEEDRKLYASMKPPTSVVVRFGSMKMIGEFPYHEDIKPGCGTKFVVRTHRGTELGEMLTSTCPNAGCSKSVTRKEMLEYIENSGGKDYPFFSITQGRNMGVIRIATAEDLAKQAAIEGEKAQMTRFARAAAARMGLNAKIVEAEPILGGERLTFHFVSEERIDFRELVNELAAQYHTRIEMHQVGSRDEARLVADYEKCGQHCCCKQFLKVLKPVSMKAAKIQKATLDPVKISGRCGRLMCCLRYEESTYDELRARLPKKKTRVKTEHGWGIVIDSQILTQLILVRLDATSEDVAVALEEITMSVPAGQALPAGEHDVFRDGPASGSEGRAGGPGGGGRPEPRGPGAGGGGGGGRDGRDGRGPRPGGPGGSSGQGGPGGGGPRQGPPRGARPPGDRGPGVRSGDQARGPGGSPGQSGQPGQPGQPGQSGQRPQPHQQSSQSSQPPSARQTPGPRVPESQMEEQDQDDGLDDGPEGMGESGPGGSGGPGAGDEPRERGAGEGPEQQQRRRRRRRRRRGGGGGAGGGGGGGNGGGSTGGGEGPPAR